MFQQQFPVFSTCGLNFWSLSQSQSASVVPEENCDDIERQSRPILKNQNFVPPFLFLTMGTIIFPLLSSSQIWR